MSYVPHFLLLSLSLSCMCSLWLVYVGFPYIHNEILLFSILIYLMSIWLLAQPEGKRKVYFSPTEWRLTNLPGNGINISSLWKRTIEDTQDFVGESEDLEKRSTETLMKIRLTFCFTKKMKIKSKLKNILYIVNRFLFVTLYLKLIWCKRIVYVSFINC